ncbi:MAG TPA: MBL fold metallo-hydrolase [Lapillicoccus sp.]|uniref:MBL fold metallo-hydrolase n=1 Tax=Lapillicoccus sp. TaxID=1909287 RepID=UPI002F955CE4
MRGAGGFVEIGDGVHFARYPQWDVCVGLVVGRERALAVDTRGTEVQGREVLDDLARLALPVPVTVVVNTHVHYDHTFGNRAFDSATIHAHQRVGQTFDADAERLKARFRADPEPGPDASYSTEDVRDLLDTEPRGPDVTFATTANVDLGGRVVHLAYAGRGHTDGDIRIWVPDAGVVFLGDLIEESADPSLGSDSWPLEWAATLDRHLHAVPPDAVVVPSHGTLVDTAFVARQRDEMAALAEVIRERHAAGVPLAQVQREADERLPYPLPWLADAFARGYAQLSGVV